jgi:hypothetical protein
MEDAIKVEKQKLCRQLAESTHADAVRASSSFYIYDFESEKSRSSLALWIQGSGGTTAIDTHCPVTAH